MPKAAKTRSSKARSDPLKPTSANNSKKAAEAKKEDEKVDASSKGILKKKPSPPDSYLLLVRLNNSYDPVITRLLSVPTAFNFEQFHRVLQTAFGWAGCHAYSFSVSKLLEEGERPNFMTGRGQEILHLMPDDGMKDAYPDPEQIKKMADYTLADIYDGQEYKSKVEVSYEYDHGDSWDHDIVFLGCADPILRKTMQIPNEMMAFCLSGEGHPCAEDCGSTPGWEDLKACFKKKSDPEGRKEWYKTICANGDPKGLDPYKWNVFDVNDEFIEMKW